MSQQQVADQVGEALRRRGDLLIVQNDRWWFGDDSWEALRAVENEILSFLYCERPPQVSLTRILPYDLPPGAPADARYRFDDWAAVATLTTTGAPAGNGRLFLATRPLEEVATVTYGKLAIDDLLAQFGDSLIKPEPPLFD